MSPGRVLVAELGKLTALRVALGLGWRRLRERPFRALEPAQDRRERLSRKQVLPAILLYRELLARLSPERALEVTGRVIHAGAVAHLGKTLGRVDAHDLAALPAEARRAKVEAWIDRFFTATAEIDEVSAREVRFTVHACALVRLTRDVGHPELGSAFCTGDKAFFENQTPPIVFTRPQTLAGGGMNCPFTLTLREGEEA